MGHNVDMTKVYFTEKQIINLNKFKCEGRILDIGGGGEGVIGQLFGEQVIAIDPSKRELEEAPEDKPLKIIMDARELKFLDNQFNTVTSFFTMMYIENKDKEKVFKEIYRVLKPGGYFLLWDANIPVYDNGEKDIYAILLTIQLEDRIIETGYGVPWPEREQSVELYANLGNQVGLKVKEQNENGETFFIKFQK